MLIILASLCIPGKPEVQLYVLFTSSNQVLLKWSLLSRGNSAVKRYLIRYSLGAGSPWINQVTISPAVTFYLMRDLKSSTKYHVELLATNEHFTSEPSVVEASTQKSGKLLLRTQKQRKVKVEPQHIHTSAPLATPFYQKKTFHFFFKKL